MSDPKIIFSSLDTKMYGGRPYIEFYYSSQSLNLHMVYVVTGTTIKQWCKLIKTIKKNKKYSLQFIVSDYHTMKINTDDGYTTFMVDTYDIWAPTKKYWNFGHISITLPNDKCIGALEEAIKYLENTWMIKKIKKN